ncbi:hypothetical protein CHARACLAT_026759 [Characodon lateralis]|uniref:Uncharacterized protein n=1 Tax=Characodon lateralis TaxID=208331 RepID=A0ABU7EXK8_9TELE|nr:hypothetical protein [Characodon lateralis]
MRTDSRKQTGAQQHYTKNIFHLGAWSGQSVAITPECNHLISYLRSCLTFPHQLMVNHTAPSSLHALSATHLPLHNTNPPRKHAASHLQARLEPLPLNHLLPADTTTS